jgi:hypothetical protein
MVASMMADRFALAKQPCPCSKVKAEESKEWEAKNSRRLKRSPGRTFTYMYIFDY